MTAIVKKGVYALFDGEQLVYIGQSNSLYSRIGNHIRENTKTFDSFELFPLPDNYSDVELSAVEYWLIAWFNPKYNKACTSQCGKGHSHTKKKYYVRAIKALIEEECDEIENRKSKFPHGFCFCKDCQYYPDNMPKNIHYMTRESLLRNCPARNEWEVRARQCYTFDGCMRGIPKDAEKYKKKDSLTVTEEMKKEAANWIGKALTGEVVYGK